LYNKNGICGKIGKATNFVFIGEKNKFHILFLSILTWSITFKFKKADIIENFGVNLHLWENFGQNLFDFLLNKINIMPFD